MCDKKNLYHVLDGEGKSKPLKKFHEHHISTHQDVKDKQNKYAYLHLQV